MHADPIPILRDLVLIGGGHSHVGVLRHLAMRPLPGVRVTLVCSSVDTPYSGMLPGYVAGHYGFDEVHIDLARLCRFAGARFLLDEAVGLDRAARRVQLRDRPPIDYDLVSINIGSTPQAAAVSGAAEHAVPVKPIARFNDRWLALRERVLVGRGQLRIAVVGAGAGGVELLLSMQHRLARDLAAMGRSADAPRFHLFSADAQILPTHAPAVRRRFEALLHERGVSLHAGAAVVQVDPEGLRTDDGRHWPADAVVWVTQAGGAPWLARTGLAVSDAGFLRVNACLQSVSDPAVFAAGDIAALDGAALEKAGVFAVRMGMPLAENLARALAGRPLRAWRPQRRWLALIGTGGRHAVASRGAFHAAGGWVWRWKEWIDRRFMRRFTELPVMAPAAPAARPAVAGQDEDAQQALAALAMRCGGCGAKVGASVLQRALAALPRQHNPDVLVGLQDPDDAAVVRVPAGKAMVHTVDFFRAFIDDPWRFGRIAAQHALGDIWAMGAEPQSATAIATLPPGLDRQVEGLLRPMMAGAVEVLQAAGCVLVGGHTGEGRELALGFAVNGLIDADLRGLMTKGGLRPGEVLVLTKPLGTGVLLAAHEQWAARGIWVHGAIASMDTSGRAAAAILGAQGVRACTDVTGFGLLGHLEEMARASGMDVELDLAAVPLLEGALACSEAGVASSLYPANRRRDAAIRDLPAFEGDPRLPLLFDPQTAGGLLASVDPDRAAGCVLALRAAGHAQAAVIGQVLGPADGAAPLRLKGSGLSPGARAAAR